MKPIDPVSQKEKKEKKKPIDRETSKLFFHFDFDNENTYIHTYKHIMMLIYVPPYLHSNILLCVMRVSDK